MSDKTGDVEKQPAECKALGSNKMKCPNLKETGVAVGGAIYIGMTLADLHKP